MIKKKKNLMSDPIFLCLILFGIFLTLFLAYLIFDYNNLKVGVCWSPTCVETFFTFFDLPIKTLAAFGTIAGLYGVVFRSVQTADHIEEILRQNNFSNYIEHKKEFMRLLESIENNFEGVLINNKEYLYLSLFPENTPQQEIQFQSIKFQNIVNHFNESMSQFKKIEPNESNRLFSLERPINQLMYAYHDLHLECVDEFPISKALSPSGHEIKMIPKARIIELRSIIMLLGRFCLPMTWRENTCDLVVEYKEFDNSIQDFTDNPVYTDTDVEE